jgi:hypothetical protein
MLPNVLTARYANPNIAASGLVAVGITRYPPRFPLSYALKANLYDLAPSPALLARGRAGTLAPGAFDAMFEQQLDLLGATEIIRQLAAIQGSTDGVVLLCYEDVTQGESCHRRMLAAWLKDKAGLFVPELEDPGRAAKKAPNPKQGGLF